MFGPTNLKTNPYVSSEFDYPSDFEAPPIEYTSCSDYLYMAIEHDRLDKIYAMRVLPLHDILAFKVKYKDDEDPISEIIMRPEFCLMKRIWDCGNKAFNSGITHYIYHSRDCMRQYSNRPKYPQNTPAVNEWYYKVLLGRNV